jgi:HK97 gp10 family phage protein
VRIQVTPPPRLDLSSLEDGARRAALEALRAGVMMIANDAKLSVARGAKSGRIYTHYFRTGSNGGVFPVERRSVPHQASAPGEAPATDTGRLLNSISSDAAIEGNRLVAFVRAATVYARYLEYGTRKIAPRPFLVPAVERNRTRVEGLVRIAYQTAAGQFARKRR